MKKTLIVLMMVLFATMLIVSCNGDAGDSEPKTINITYDLDGGTLDEGVTNPTSAMTGDEITPTAPTRGGGSEKVTNYDDGSFKYESATVTTAYNFKGWKVKGSEDSTAAASYTAERKDVTLVAVWEVKATVSDVKGITLSSKVSVKKMVTLGVYNKEGIVWTVIAVENNRALLVSNKCIGGEMQHSTSTSSYSWDSSLIKSWLNGTGETGFVYQSGLSEVKMVTPNSTVGTVFLLSEEEAMTTYEKILDRVLGCKWWLRDGDGNNCKYMNASTPPTVSSQDASYRCGVRPAFWISL